MQCKLREVRITLQKVLSNKKGYLEENYHFFHLKDTAGQEMDYHFHEFNKLVYLISGKVDYAVEDTVYSLNPGDVLLVKHHTIHKALIDRTVPYERVIIYLDENRYSSVMPEAGLTRCFDKCLYTPEDSQIVDLLRELEHCADPVLKETYLLQLLAVLNSMKGSSPEEIRYDEKTERVLTYINENLSSDLSVDELADQVYLSRYHFMRLFKEATGETVHQYVRRRRLLNASRLIREGCPATQAAKQSGFEDYSVFYKAFKENFGFSPKELKI